jgi:hypothetical protein
MDKGLILKALLEIKPKSLLCWSLLRQAWATFIGHGTPAVRPYVIPHLETLLSTVQQLRQDSTTFGHQVM